METNESIEQVFDNLDKNIVYKTRKSILTGLILLLIGVASLFYYSTLVSGSANIITQIIFVTGMICIIVGIFKFFYRKSYYVSSENHTKIKNFEIRFNAVERERLVRLAEGGNLSELKQLSPSVIDGLKLRVMATKDGKICFSQVIAFINYEYVNLTSVQKHSVADYQIIAEISKFAKRN